ncbi:MAG: WYL domain-containing protein [Spirochaetales bacterium]|nr:WYL domain-containing protein [Spirochaetales bacterium]
MSNLHRIQWVDHQIRENRFPNCNTIAEQFCISARQASRDIEYLKDSLGAPIEYSSKKRGYYYTEKTFVFPAVFLAEEEKKALSYLADRYKAVGGEMTDRLAALFEKLTGGETQSAAEMAGVPVYHVSREIVSTIEAIKKAIAEKVKIVIDYTDSAMHKTKRTVRPYIIHGKSRAQYLHAFCEFRHAERDFRIDRIHSVFPTTDSFSLPAYFDSSKYAGEAVFNFRQPYIAEILFDAQPSPSGNTAENRPATETIPFESSAILFKKLLGRATAFTILSPEWLKNKFAAYIQNILNKNQ